MIKRFGLPKVQWPGVWDLDVLILKRYVDMALRAIQLPSALTVLDAGCGAGVWTAYLARLVPDARVVGMDNNAAVLEQAGALCRSLGLGTRVSLRHQDLINLAITEEFDFILCMNAIHYYNAEDVIYLRLLFQALRPGGYLLFIGPAQDDLVPGYFRRYRTKHGYKGYTIQTLQEKSAQVRLLPVHIRYIVGQWGRLTKELAWWASSHRAVKLPVYALAYAFMLIDWIRTSHTRGNFVLGMFRKT